MFAPGEYRPETTPGKRLLAHELTHVAQQAQGKSYSTVLQRQLADPWTNFKRQIMGGNYVEPVTSGPTSKMPEPEYKDPGYTESA